MSAFHRASMLAIASTTLIALPAQAATDGDLAQIREEIRALKAQYEARIRALEEKLEAARSASSAAQPPATAAPQPVSAAPPLIGAGGGGGLAAFNPAMSVVLQGTYGRFSADPQRFAIAGFQKSEDVSPGRRGLGLGESELNLFANVDDKFAGNITVALTPENTVSVEEAYGYMPSLANGVVPKFGRFFSALGYLNEQHQHAWDFVDAPLVYQALLGGQFTQDGAQVKWVAPTDQFIELGAEIGNGDSFPGSSRNNNGAGSWAVFAHTGGDIGESHSWRAGVSFLDTRAHDRAGTQPDRMGRLADIAFTGTSHVAAADLVWKWAPNGNPRERNLKLQAEYLWRRERGSLTYDATGALGRTNSDAYSSAQSGWYVQGAYQFMPYWRAGLRYDRMNPASPSYGNNTDLLDIGSFHPDRATVMFDYTPSEFSRFRVQYANSRTRPDVTDHELFLQYILTLGAHGAHKF